MTRVHTSSMSGLSFNTNVIIYFSARKVNITRKKRERIILCLIVKSNATAKGIVKDIAKAIVIPL
ncbi:hypothetical protein SAMN04488054_1532 [Salibacterium qingdaonense]|uniref:Uncharacterized protein n=1 Tax=Salibacterium qingdaonense TaxID=266892 RepID=A0A1I4QYQ5_9BACI|nr:hypothetical protein SAMN04488054_1532 [Salibacterium qingdaonense]